MIYSRSFQTQTILRFCDYNLLVIAVSVSSHISLLPVHQTSLHLQQPLLYFSVPVCGRFSPLLVNCPCCFLLLLPFLFSPNLLASLSQSFPFLPIYFHSLIYYHSCLCLVVASHKTKISLVIVRRVVVVKETCTCPVFGMSVPCDSPAVGVSCSSISVSMNASIT